MTELHVIALSGGNDSTAMALRLKEIEPREYTYVLTPTGDESEETFAHWRNLKDILGGTFLPIVADTLVGLIEKQNALPNWRQRWCTRILKIEPYAKWLTQQTKFYDRVISYVGIRADEPERESGDYSDIAGVEMRFPLREWAWNEPDVISYNDSQGITIPKRTDCEICFFQRLGEWRELWQNKPAKYAEGERLETLTGHTFRSPSRDTWPASLAELRVEFESGRVPRAFKGDVLKATQCRVCRM